MKEMLKSKVFVGFVVFVLGFTYLNSFQFQNNDTSMVVQKDTIRTEVAFQ